MCSLAWHIILMIVYIKHIINVLYCIYYYYALCIILLLLYSNAYIGTVHKPASGQAKHYHAIIHAFSAPTVIKPQKSPRTHLYMSQNGHRVL